MERMPDHSGHVNRRWQQVGGWTHDQAARFTRIIAYEIRHGLNGAARDERCGLWFKQSDSAVQDRDPDKLAFRMGDRGVWFVDIVGDAGIPSARPTWQDDPNRMRFPDDDLRNWREPAPEPGVHDATPAPPQHPPAPPANGDDGDDDAGAGGENDADLLALAHSLDLVAVGLVGLAARLDTLDRRLAEIQASGVPLKVQGIGRGVIPTPAAPPPPPTKPRR